MAKQIASNITWHEGHVERVEREKHLGQKGVTITGQQSPGQQIQGSGGIGKTALALVLADRLKDQYPDAQFYLDL